MALPTLQSQAPDENDPTLPDDAILQQFYSAAMAQGSTGSESLDLLLQKGLYGKYTPSELRGKKAAEAFQSAFDLIGGIPRLALWADKNPTAFFTLYSKLIPASIKAEVNGTIKIDAPWMSPNRLAYMQKGEVIDVESKDKKE